MTIEPKTDGSAIRYTIRLMPRGDQEARTLQRILLYPRIPNGRAIRRVTVDGQDVRHFTRDCVVLAQPKRGVVTEVLVEAGAW